MNEEFAAYLDGKSVAIVGRANLDDLEQGDKIDSYDVVVRMHHPLPYVPKDSPYFPVEHEYKGFNFNYPEHWKKRIGARTDIFYLSDLEDNSVALAAKDLDNMKPIRYVCCEPDCNMFLAAQLAEQRFVRFITYGHVSCCRDLTRFRPAERHVYHLRYTEAWSGACVYYGFSVLGRRGQQDRVRMGTDAGRQAVERFQFSQDDWLVPRAGWSVDPPMQSNSSRIVSEFMYK